MPCCCSAAAPTPCPAACRAAADPPPSPPAADREGALHRRVQSSCSDSQAVADHYESKKLLHTIDAERPPECVFAQICQVMENF
ncbi:hypothetical protein CgunFtcFv8_023750 [Champsocephalus gunnari]|uniref:Uncharacterized protein n=1 Tax=Champsocephalus gunnari TaxID=52237 RepID=A0AAN8DGX0_CHAGU|nr:hypothetical protein CgunFtcFv8_023750 [Champsocephalus gunnari]